MPLLPVAPPAVGLTPPSTSNAAAGGGATAVEQTNATLPVFSAALTLALGQVASAVQKAATGRSAETPSAAGEPSAGAEGDAASDASAALPLTLGGTGSVLQGGGNEPAQLGADTATGIAADVAAAAAVLTAAPIAAVSTPSVNAPVEATGIRRSLDLLAPEFRERLERVIDRMESEFGYTVEVVETTRSQSRQDTLFARGRTEAGQVVTWTRASNHTVGHAADVVIDGSYADALPYERLAGIAREEGLRTLGARDPGHIELTPARSAHFSPSPMPDVGAPPAPRQPRTVIGRAAPSVASLPSIVPTAAELQSRLPATVATVATVAPVARVAQVAQVARVAQVRPATATGIGRQSETSVSASLRQPTTSSPVGLHAATTASLGRAETRTAEGEVIDAEPNAEWSRGQRPTSASASATASEVLRQVRDDLMQAVVGTDPNAPPSSLNSGASPVSGVTQTDMSERIARLLKVQDAAGDHPLSQVLLRLERPDGGEDRVRVALRGSAISATLDVGDQAAADKLGANVKELQRALERHGFETEALTVRSATRPVESASVARALGVAAETDLQRAAASASPNNTSSRDRGARHDEQRPSPDSQRHRARRDQKGDR